VVDYREPNGTRRRVSVEGDFHMGRMTIADGPFLTVMDHRGKMDRLTICSLSVSRLGLDASGGVERSHARVFWRRNKAYIQDMGSSNGTTLNGSRIRGWDKGKVSEPVEMGSRTPVGLGKYEITLEPIFDKEVSIELDEEGVPLVLPGECIDMKGVFLKAYSLIPERYPHEMDLIAG